MILIYVQSQVQRTFIQFTEENIHPTFIQFTNKRKNTFFKDYNEYISVLCVCAIYVHFNYLNIDNKHIYQF